MVCYIRCFMLRCVATCGSAACSVLVTWHCAMLRLVMLQPVVSNRVSPRCAALHVAAMQLRRCECWRAAVSACCMFRVPVCVLFLWWPALWCGDNSCVWVCRVLYFVVIMSALAVMCLTGLKLAARLFAVLHVASTYQGRLHPVVFLFRYAA